MVLANSKQRQIPDLDDVYCRCKSARCLTGELDGNFVGKRRVCVFESENQYSGSAWYPSQSTSCNSCNERSAKARDLIDQKEVFYEKDFSLSGDPADRQAVKRTKQSLVEGVAGATHLNFSDSLKHLTTANLVSPASEQRLARQRMASMTTEGLYL